MIEKLISILDRIGRMFRHKQPVLIILTIVVYLIFTILVIPNALFEAVLNDLLFIFGIFFINIFLKPYGQRIYTYIISLLLITLFILDITYIQFFTDLSQVNDIPLLLSFIGQGSELFVMPILVIIIVLIATVLSILYFLTEDRTHYVTYKQFKKLNLIGITTLIIVLNMLVPTSAYTDKSITYDNDFLYLTSDTYLYESRNNNIKYSNNYGYFHYRINDMFTKTKQFEVSEEELIKLLYSKDSFTSNEYTNKYKDYNLINIIAESVDFRMVNEDITPNLFYLLNNSLVYDNYFNTPVSEGETCASELMTFTSLYPVRGNEWESNPCFHFANHSYKNSLPLQLEDNGYNTYYVHNALSSYYNRDVLIPRIGFNNYYFGGDTEGLTNDYHLDEQLIELYENNIDFSSKFYIQTLTFATHVGFDEIYADNYTYLEDNNLLTNDITIDNYNAKLISFDNYLGSLIQLLKDNGVYNNTLISIYPDHPVKAYDSVTQHTLIDTHDEYKQKLIIHDGGTTIKNEDYLGHHVDIAPTLLNMLLGNKANYDYFIGTDINDNNAFLLFNDNYVYYNNTYYKEEELSTLPKEIQDQFVLSKKKINLSKYILDNNLS